MEKIFEASVISVGSKAEEMIGEANMIILFGEEAPNDLAEYCYKISNKNLIGTISPGGEIVIDGTHILITSVGDIVEKNLVSLGHITISMDGNTQKTLPGMLHVEKGIVTKIQNNTVIQIFS
ncbi:MAG TPA: PTS glucitol/sorbitol transporter subunit IIA [Lactovum miscens]|uniref:PTS glucitol/sorbitol transporter subunit IIA n=1 Tax=Lactovum miscens TaxID=190387 RepID=UPI002ED8D7AF